MKKGFTLVEIIISIGLIVLIGTVSIVSFNLVKKKETANVLSNKSEDILNAANVYVETNSEIKNKLYNSKEGVAIPLSVLESSGLIDFEGIDINDEYIVTMLGSEVAGDECVSTYTLKSWDFPNDKVIYICTSDNKNSINIKEKLTYGDGYYIARGSNPNNYVEFSVNSDDSKSVYFQSDDKNLWRIVSIDNDGKIKLAYNQLVGTNNELMYDTANVFNYNDVNYYFIEGYGTSYYYRYVSNDAWTISEVISDTGKKAILLNNIVNRDWLVKSKYTFSYTNIGSGIEDAYISPTIELEMGTITQDEFRESLLFNETWIPAPFVIGSTRANYTDYVLYIDTSGAIGYMNQKSRVSGSTYNLGGSNYLPVIVLNEKVKILNNSSCESNATLGSKECPYKLECSAC